MGDRLEIPGEAATQLLRLHQAHLQLLRKQSCQAHQPEYRRGEWPAVEKGAASRQSAWQTPRSLPAVGQTAFSLPICQESLRGHKIYRQQTAVDTRRLCTASLA